MWSDLSPDIQAYYNNYRIGNRRNALFYHLGKLTIDAFYSRDTDLVVCCLILTTALSTILMMIEDIIYAYIDPRIKARYAK